MEERYFTQYVAACKENGFKSHYVIYQKNPLCIATKKKYKRFANALRAKEKLEFVAADGARERRE